MACGLNPSHSLLFIFLKKIFFFFCDLRKHRKQRNLCDRDHVKRPFRFRVSHPCSVGSIAGTVLAAASPWLSLTTCILRTLVLFTLKAALWGEDPQQLYFNEIIISKGGKERLANWRRFTQRVPVVEAGLEPRLPGSKARVLHPLLPRWEWW